MGLFLATLELVSWGPRGGGSAGGVSPPRSPLVLRLLVLLVLFRLLLLLSPASSPSLTQPLRYGSMPTSLLPASYLPNPYSTERAMSGSFPNIRPNSVTPTMCVPPRRSRHSTRTPRGSAPHVCTLTTGEEKQEASVF